MTNQVRSEARGEESINIGKAEPMIDPYGINGPEVTGISGAGVFLNS